MPPAKKQPKREFRIARIQIAVYADVLEDGRKVDEAIIGATDDNGATMPYTLYDLEALADWAAVFRVQLANMEPEASPNGH